jgi:hypothetical protein
MVTGQTFAGNQIYRYKDDSGTQHFTTEWQRRGAAGSASRSAWRDRKTPATSAPRSHRDR